MLKRTPKALSRYLGLISILYAVVSLGMAAQLIIATHDHDPTVVDAFFVANLTFRFSLFIAFALCAAKCATLLATNPKALKTVVHVNFIGQVLLAIVGLFSGRFPNVIGAVIQIAIYFYLLILIDDLSGPKTTGGIDDSGSPGSADPTAKSVSS